MSYLLHPGAEQDVANAIDFYALQAGGAVAKRFLAEFGRIANLLVQYPGFGTPAKSGRRVFPLQVFPYSVVYREEKGGVLILVVRHQHRKPGYGGGRR
jgi:plasmid stabilization system protein ParE